MHIMVQDWVNKIQNENVVINCKDASINLKDIETKIKEFTLPSTELINKMSLQESLAYEVMLINIVDNTPTNQNFNIKILFHLKLITNNQIHKFRIFE